MDLDGDGLEAFVLDDVGRIASCIDGDRTVIEGRDCWQDGRMADGFAMSFDLSLVPAVFLGLRDGWERLVTGTCESPPESSLWGET